MRTDLKASTPKISVVVRARNERSNIVDTLTSLERQTFKDFETIIVDNCSNDGTKRIVKDFLRENQTFPAKTILESKIGRGKALHTGIRVSKTEWVATLDADSFAHRRWLETIVDFISENPQHVAGSGEIHFTGGPKHHKLLYKEVRNIIFSLAANREVGWLSLANSWFRKSTFLASGGTKGYPRDVITDDKVLALQLRKFGKIVFVKNAKVHTENWLKYKPFWLSNLWYELEQTREVSDIERPSSFQRFMKPISKGFQMFDSLNKIEVR